MRLLMLSILLLGLHAEDSKPAEVQKPAAGPDSQANLPETAWPIGFQWSAGICAGWKGIEKQHASGRADVLVWTPPEQVRLRAAFLVPNNSDSKKILEHEAVRAVAARQGIGLIFLRIFDGGVVEFTEAPEQAETIFAGVLAQVAERTGRAGFRHAPWITLGKSSRGRFPFRTTWRFPTRVIASISYHGETPTWPMSSWSQVGDETVLHLAINGEQEWDGTWYRHVRPCLLDYHLNRQWLTHQVVLHGVGHGNYVDTHGGSGWDKPVPEGAISCRVVWDYIARYIDVAMDLRVPADADPAQGPVSLKTVDRDSGWLIHPRAIEELLGLRWHPLRFKDGAYQTVPWPEEPSPVYDPNPGTVARDQLIRRASDVPPAERRHRLWIPNLDLLRAWLALHEVGGRTQGLLPKAE